MAERYAGVMMRDEYKHDIRCDTNAVQQTENQQDLSMVKGLASFVEYQMRGIFHEGPADKCVLFRPVFFRYDDDHEK
ncbi:MAG: hypothetical protein JW874_07455 [Spirochaetales bacterium]|nr:hypothetical protein [Spirochaetales bacterium]